jgi:hypothetical protein
LYHSLDVTVVAVGAGFTYGTAGYSHHAVEDLTIMRSLRKIKIFSPANSAEVKGSLKVIMNASGPNYIRLGKLLDFSHDLSMLNGEPIQIKLGLNEGFELPRPVEKIRPEDVTDEFLKSIDAGSANIATLNIIY